jgi:hypothetical protein
MTLPLDSARLVSNNASFSAFMKSTTTVRATNLTTSEASVPIRPNDMSAALPENWLSAIRQFFSANVRFAVIALEFYLLVALVERFQLESQTFHRVLLLAFAGFVLHHFLPARMKLPFFAALSLFATVAVVDSISALSLTGPGVALVLLGLTFISLCHLPIPFAARVILIVALGGGLTLVRANYQWFPTLDGIWPILASMFMFRLMIYLYDLKHQSAEFSISRSLSYFFMVPNACFPLFPIVDYKTFCTTYYNDDAVNIYQTGIKWMFRGIIQLLLYRLVYQFGLLNIADVRNLGDVAEFMLATYLLYLRVSGQFHLIVGLLHMFGFNLPETHHLYYLASSFTDFWRRINIYWKDFIMKLFFYPAFFALRSLGTVRTIAVGTLLAFFATWVLHSWQWFWFRGQLFLTWQDISFWTILALLVAVNAVIEAVRGRRRSLTPATLDFPARLLLGAKTIGTFCVICALWTLWSCQSADELWILAESAIRASSFDVVKIIVVLSALGIAGAYWGSSTQEMSLGRGTSTAVSPNAFWRSILPTGLGIATLLLLTLSPIQDAAPLGSVLAAIQHDQLNARDVEMQRRGYYEELDLARGNDFMWDNVMPAPEGWTDVDRLFRDREDFIHREMIPGARATLCGVEASVNSWGMRDHDYSKDKPPGTYRYLLYGSSHEVGSGVGDNETFDNIVEDRLNASDKPGNHQRYEILNCSVGGFSIFEKLNLLERSGFDFNPDGVLFTICSGDRQFILEHLARAAQAERSLPYDYLQQLFQTNSIDSRLSSVAIERRLAPHVPEMYQWIFSRLRNECEKRGIEPIVIFRPAPLQTDRRDASRRSELLGAATDSGISVIDLSPAFDQVDDRKTLILAEWDDHTNVIGHRLLADQLYEQLDQRNQQRIARERKE